MIYMPPDPFHELFEEIIDLRHFDLKQHQTAGLCLAQFDGCLYLGSMAPSTPGSKIPCWHTWIKGAWLIKIGPDTVTTIQEAQETFA